MKKAPPQKSAPPPSIPKEEKPIVELKAKEVTIDEKVSNILFDNILNTHLWKKNIIEV